MSTADHHKEKKLASLEQITADTIKRKQRWQHQMQQEINSISENSFPACSPSSSSTSIPNSGTPTTLQTDHLAAGVKVLNRDGVRVSPHADEVSRMEVDGVGKGVQELQQGARSGEIPSFQFDEDDDSEGEVGR